MSPFAQFWRSLTESLCGWRGHHFIWQHDPADYGLRCRNCTLGRRR